MIEIRRIYTIVDKDTGKPKKIEQGLKPPVLAENIFCLFRDAEKLLAGESDRTNLYYTLGHKKPDHTGTGRTWFSQDVITFDVDHCSYLDDGKLAEGYAEILEKALGLEPGDYGMVATGYGLQLIIPIAKPITEKTFFDKHKLHYEVCLRKISEQLNLAKLPGITDPSAFEPNRLHRMPNTLNQKPGRGDRTAYIVTPLPEKCSAWNIIECSGLPKIDAKDELPLKQVNRLKIDVPMVETCEFLKWAKANQNDVNEPQWYALTTITARLDETGATAHAYSKDYKGYKPHEVDRKIEYAKKAAGPRTCDNINNLWGKCDTCPHFKKVNSPISLKGDDFIATKDSGFWFFDKNGKPQTADYAGLLKHYESLHSFMNLGDNHYVYTGTHYEHMSIDYAKGFCEAQMNPKPLASHRHEFSAKALLYNRHEDATKIMRTAGGKINFRNGVFDLVTGEIKPHSPEHFFTYTLSYDYDPIAVAPKFIKFMNEVTRGNEALKNILLEYMGYSISGCDSKAHKFLVCTGTGANGKSTLMQVLQSLVGGIEGKAFSSIPFRKLGEEFSNIRLFNKLFNIMDESEIYLEKSQFETLKDYCVGGLVAGAKKFKDAIEFQNTAKFILLCNEIPKGGNPNKGLYRRMLIVPFTAEFEGAGADAFMAEKLVEELPGIMNMVLEAYWRLQKRGFKFEDTDELKKSLDNYKEENDNVTRWASMHVMQGELGSVRSIRELRGAYDVWVSVDGEKPVAINQFTKRLLSFCKDKGIKTIFHPQKKLGGQKLAAIEGISLDTGAEEF